MKKLKKYLPIVLLLAFVALLIAIAIGVSRRGPIAPTAPISKPAAGSCLLTFDITPLACNGTCQLDTQCGSGMKCYLGSSEATPSASPSTGCANPQQTVVAWDSVNAANGTRSYAFTRTVSALNTQYPQWEITASIDGNAAHFSTVSINDISFTNTAALLAQYNGDDSVLRMDYQGKWTKLVSFPGPLQVVASGSATLPDSITIAGRDDASLATSRGVNIKYCAPVAQTGFCRNVACETAASCICATPTPTPTPPPVCNDVCSSNTECTTGMTCYKQNEGDTSGYCRNPSCTSANNCLCTSPTPTPTPTDTPKGGFYIRKYYDHNGNGTQDSGDEGLTWNFQWTKDNGATWNDYQTDATKLGEGGVVYLDGGTKVQIKEKAADTWTATTPTTVDLTIKLNDNQLMVFGNWHGATPTPTPVLSCNSVCSTNSDCPSSMNCVDSACRNPSCAGSTNCICQTTSTPTPTPTPETLPRSGAIDDTLKLVGAGVGALLLGLVGLLAL